MPRAVANVLACNVGNTANVAVCVEREAGVNCVIDQIIPLHGSLCELSKLAEEIGYAIDAMFLYNLLYT